MIFFQAALLISSIPKSKKDKIKNRESRKEDEEVKTWFQSKIITFIERLDFIDTLNILTYYLTFSKNEI